MPNTFLVGGLTGLAMGGARKVASNVSNIIDLRQKRITSVDKNAKINFNQLPNTFLVVGLTGLAMCGARKVASNVSNINRGGAKATNADMSLNYIKENKLSENDTAKEKQANYDKIKVQMLENASKNIQAMNAPKRTKYLKSLEILSLRFKFNADGTVNYDTQNSDKYNKNA